MNIYIENEYDREIDVDYTDIINKVVCQAVDFIKCPYECEVNVTIVDNNTISRNKQGTKEKLIDLQMFCHSRC